MNLAPVLLLIHRRRRETSMLIDALSKVRPPKVYVSGDGPSADGSDLEAVATTRELFAKLPWHCEIVTNFLQTNLGCKNAVNSGLDWFFSKEPEGIVLEEDTIPDPSFIYFASEMLHRYRYDTRIMKVSGHNPIACPSRSPSEYFFSHVSYSWGWASWRRAWLLNDPEMSTWDQARKSGIVRYPQIDAYSRRVFRKASRGFDTWDYQWDYSIAVQNGLHIVPTVNLVRNVGFSPSATHTSNPHMNALQPAIEPLTDFPTLRPEFLAPNLFFQRRLRAFQLRQKIYLRAIEILKPYRLGTPIRE